MGKSSSDRRKSNGLANVYGPATALGRPIIDQVDMAFGVQRCAEGKWRALYYEGDESFAGFELIDRDPLRPAVVIKSGRYSPPTITMGELLRNAGCYGKSSTMGRPEWKRLQRHAKWDREKILAPEDAIERAIMKVRVWPFPANVVGHDKDGKPIFGDLSPTVHAKQA